jgi:Putative restriction endonuclease
MSEVSTRYRYFLEGEYLDEDDMPETPRQHTVANYLEDVLGWFFRFENYIIKHAGISQAEFDDLKSYAISPPTYPAPAVAIEIVSDSTRPIDTVVAKKPTRYGELGVKEYFAFDPEMAKPVVKLMGWRYIDGLRTELKADKRGWLWSAELECWLANGGKVLVFYDANGNELISGREAERQAREAEALARQKAEQLAEQNKLAKEEAEKLLEAERRAREEAERLIAELRAKLEGQSPS